MSRCHACATSRVSRADSFDGRGNYTLGIKEQLVFPEINYDKIDKVRGMEITIVTTARTDEEGRRLLQLLGHAVQASGPTSVDTRNIVSDQRIQDSMKVVLRSVQYRDIAGLRARKPASIVAPKPGFSPWRGQRWLRLR